jgi:predicted  nucleic acid-binding Zn-ribbon protein
MYKLRGVLMRTYRALLLVEAIKRLLHGNPQKRLEKLRRQLADHEVALEQLRTEIRDLESQLAAESPPAAVAEPAADQAAA